VKVLFSNAFGDSNIFGSLNHPISVIHISTTDIIVAGEDPWGGFRRGFAGEVDLTLADYGIDYNLGPDAKEVQLMLSIEGVRQ